MAQFLHQECLGLVLAGGRSMRMGQDKARLLHNQQNMLNFSKEILHNCGVSQVVVSGDEHGIKDLIPQFGPLGGIYSVAEQLKPQALLILPVDLPLMTAKELSELKRVGQLSQKAVYFNDNFLPLYLPLNGFVEQFFAQMLTTKANSAITTEQKQRQKNITAYDNLSTDKAAIKKNKRQLSGPSIRSLLAQVPHTSIAAKNNSSLFNANTPDQWQQAKQQFTILRKNNV